MLLNSIKPKLLFLNLLVNMFLKNKWKTFINSFSVNISNIWFLILILYSNQNKNRNEGGKEIRKTIALYSLIVYALCYKWDLFVRKIQKYNIDQ